MQKVLVNYEGKIKDKHILLINSVIELGIEKYFKLKKDAEVNFYNVSKKVSRNENKLVRDVDKATDVISIPFNELNPESNNILVGELLVCFAVIKKQAKELSHSFERELAYATIHGLLHCFGYDHIKPADESKMLKAQNDVLDSLGINR